MFDPSPARHLILSATAAVAGSLALALSAAAAPTVLVPTASAVTAIDAPARQARVAPDLPETLSQQVVREQQSQGLSCAVSLAGFPLCTHPEGNQHTVASTGSASETPRGGTLGCYGDGTSGPRVRAVYARPQGAPDRYTASLPGIREWAAGISSQFDASASRTKGRRHVRFATTPGPKCALAVLEVVLPDSAFGSFRATIDALQAKGLRAAWSKYLVWSDSGGYCGMGTTYADDSPGLDNLNNSKLPGYARIDRRCWGKAETHELVHMLGGVQRSAPNATTSFHCSDGLDALCYDDRSAGSRQRQVCPQDRSQLLDCRNDDYFSTAAPRGSYLQTHWNTARSSFLSATLSDPAPAAAADQPAATGPSPAPAAAASPAPQPSATPSPSSSSRPGLLGQIGPVVLPTLAPVVGR